MTARMTGDGFVLEQSPAAGAALGAATRCVLKLGRRAAGPRRRSAAVTLRRSLRAVSDRAPLRPARRRRPCRGGGRDAQVTGVAYDSRTRSRPAPCSSRFAAPHADGAAFARDAVAAGRSRSSPKRRRLPASACPGSQVARRAAGAGGARGRLLRPSERGARARRHHRHERQDDDLVPAGVDLRGGGHAAAAASARSATASATAKSTPRARRRRRRICSGCCARWSTEGCGACVMEVSSHALALRRADHLRFARRHLHQPDPRSPRLPRRHGGVLRRRSAGCSSCCPRRRSASSNLDDRRGAAFAAVGAPTGDLRDRRAGRRPSRSADVLARRPGVRGRARRAARFTSARRSSAARTPTTSSPPSPAAMALDVPFSAIEAGRRRARERARPVPGRVRSPATTSASSSTTRTPTTR